MEDSMMAVTTIQLKTETRDRLYRMKFRTTYDQFINQMCDIYEEHQEKEEK